MRTTLNRYICSTVCSVERTCTRTGMCVKVTYAKYIYFQVEKCFCSCYFSQQRNSHSLHTEQYASIRMQCQTHNAQTRTNNAIEKKRKSMCNEMVWNKLADCIAKTIFGFCVLVVLTLLFTLCSPF